MSRISIKTNEKRFPVAEDLYGLFFEDISHAGDGGLYPEMLRNRSFEDSLMPEGCTTNDDGKTFVSPTGWIDEFNNGEGMNDWVKRGNIVPTPIPAWYAENATMELDEKMTLNEKRRVSMKVDFAPGGSVRNIGYAGVPQEKNREYHFYMFAQSDMPVALTVMVRETGKVFATASVEVKGDGWNRYDVTFTASGTTGDGEFVICCEDGGCVRFGFMSLMPADTFMGHGLRKDLVEKLQAMKPAFLRFPGGCIVEGFTIETAMLFKNTVGPVWERPSHWLLWHYRTTNGLGFHEYLQLCEDLNLSALYVCNCGMTCQGRGPYYFNEQEMSEVIQDTLNAIEYAVGSADSEWGSLRARMGHEAPFTLKYLEIGNENNGSEYEARFHKIREAVLAKYPELIIISNDHGENMKTDIVDDHYYNMPEFYAENIGLYDNYDRSKPDIFVGEFAVNQTYEGQLRAAISEAMFMVGFERNQDVVKLCSYAPLFEHVNFYSWYPNLLIYDNYRSYAIPSYYCFKLFGNNRGKWVVKSTEEAQKIYRELHGLPMITGDFGISYRGAVYNGKTVEPKVNIFGKIEKEGNICKLVEDPDNEMSKRKPPFKVYAAVALGEEVDSREGEFTIEILAEEGKEIGVGMLCAPKPFSFYDRMNPNPRDPWMLFNLEPIRWMLSDGKATVVRGGLNPQPMSEAKDVQLKMGEYNKIHYVLTRKQVSLYLNDELIEVVELPNYPSMCSVVTDTEEEVIVKVVNFAEAEDDVTISLDCNVCPEYRVELMTGNAEDENTLDEPEKVHDIVKEMTGASKEFVYTAPALSVNVIILKKQK